MNNLKQKIITKASILLHFLLKYLKFAYFIFLALMVGFLVFRIGSLSSAEPTEDEVTAKLQTIKRPKIDQSSVDKMLKLQHENVQIQTLFENYRNNPFSE